MKLLKTIEKFKNFINGGDSSQYQNNSAIENVKILNTLLETVKDDKSVLEDINNLIETLSKQNIDTEKVRNYLDNTYNNHNSRQESSVTNIYINQQTGDKQSGTILEKSISKPIESGNKISSDKISSDKISSDKISSLESMTKQTLDKQTLDKQTESLEAIESINGHLESIDKQTDKQTDSLETIEKITEESKPSKADEILKENKKDDDELSKKSELDDIKESLLLQASSFEDMGSAAVDSMFGGEDSDSGIDLDFDSEDDGKRKKKRRRSRKTRGKKGIFSKAKNFLGKGKGVAGKAMKFGGSLLKGASKIAAPAVAAVAAFDYMSADNTEERKESVGSGSGGVIGGVIGSFLGPVGTVAGAALGSYLGGLVGEYFSNPQDSIPDNIKESGPIAEIQYIDTQMIPEIAQKVQTGEISEDDAKEGFDKLQKYKQELLRDKLPKLLDETFSKSEYKGISNSEKLTILEEQIAPMKADPTMDDDYLLILDEASKILKTDKNSVKKGIVGNTVNSKVASESNLESDSVVDGPDSKNFSKGSSDKVEHYTKQGLNDPLKISIASGIPVEEVKQIMNKPQGIDTDSKKLFAPVEENKYNNIKLLDDTYNNITKQQETKTTPVSSSTSITNVYSKEDSHRFSNKSIEILRGL